MQIHWKKPVLEPLFNKVTGLGTFLQKLLMSFSCCIFSQKSSKVSNFIKKRLQHRCFLVKFGKILGTSFFTENLRRLCIWVVVYCHTLVYTHDFHKRMQAERFIKIRQNLNISSGRKVKKSILRMLFSKAFWEYNPQMLKEVIIWC